VPRDWSELFIANAPAPQGGSSPAASAQPKRGLLRRLRENSQLVVITHQKRTMECADALYGVSMRGDGVSTVVSQRLRERPDYVGNATIPVSSR